MEKIKGIGIIGCGTRMMEFLRELFLVNPNHKIVALCDPNEKALENIKEKYAKDATIYLDYIDLIKDPMVNWVFIGSINSTHKDQIIESFKNGKNVFSEKPLAISYSECEEIKKAYDKGKSNFLISYPLRYSTHYHKIKKIIEKGKIGKIVSIEFNEVLDFNHGAFIMTNWRRYHKYSGGHLLEKCCHDIDIVNWITGSNPKKVASFGGLSCFTPNNSEVYENVRAVQGEITFDEKVISNPFISDKDILDNQVAIIEYEDDVRAIFHTNCNSGIPERRLYICGTKGTIRSDLVTGKVELREVGSKEPIEEIHDPKEIIGGHGGGDEHLARELDGLIRGYTGLQKNMGDALRSTITALAIQESMKKNRIIDLKKRWKKLGLDIL